MRYVFLLLTTLLTLATGSQRASAIDSARELVSSCRELEKGRQGAGAEILIPDSRNALLCWGYMQAMQDLSVLADQQGRRIIGACPPERTTSLQLIQSFLTYAQSHASELDGNAAAAVIKAFRASFPCHQGRGRR
jgi:hypothetical protein